MFFYIGLCVCRKDTPHRGELYVRDANVDLMVREAVGIFKCSAYHEKC